MAPACLPLRRPCHQLQGRWQKNFQGRERRKKYRKRAKDQKIELLSLFQGERGGNGKKDRKIAKKHQKIAKCFFYYYSINFTIIG